MQIFCSEHVVTLNCTCFREGFDSFFLCVYQRLQIIGVNHYPLKNRSKDFFLIKNSHHKASNFRTYNFNKIFKILPMHLDVDSLGLGCITNCNMASLIINPPIHGINKTKRHFF